MVHIRPPLSHHWHLSVYSTVGSRLILWCTRNLVKCLLPEGDDLLHVVVCCKSLASQLVLLLLKALQLRGSFGLLNEFFPFGPVASFFLRDRKTRKLMDPTLATGLVTPFDATAGILWTTRSKIPPSLSVVSVSLELRCLARFEDLPSDTTKIRLTVFFKYDAI